MDNNLIIDCFAGGGGASIGIEMALGRKIDIAINHDAKAIAMHKVNHPGCIHLTEDIFAVNLKKYIKEDQKVSLMWASPDCRSFSKAKGGQPKSESVRMLPWAVYQHASNILPEVIIMENVEEIQKWGPLDIQGRQIKEKEGEEYKKFIRAMRSLGYDFDSRELRASDYGAPTTRKRWYAVFRRDGRSIVWPQKKNVLKPCGEYIDWSDLGQSVFNRSKPLAESTRKRLVLGIQKYVINCKNPYIVKNGEALKYAKKYGNSCKCASFLTKYYNTCIGQSLFEPCHTITTSPGHFGLVTAFLIKYYGTGGFQSLDSPLATITTKDRFGLVSPIVLCDGEEYVIADVFLRMLKPHELLEMQGFPSDYIIDHDIMGKPIPKADQVKRIGNSVVPIMAQALVSANCSYLKN